MANAYERIWIPIPDDSLSPWYIRPEQKSTEYVRADLYEELEEQLESAQAEIMAMEMAYSTSTVLLEAKLVDKEAEIERLTKDRDEWKLWAEQHHSDLRRYETISHTGQPEGQPQRHLTLDEQETLDRAWRRGSRPWKIAKKERN